MDRWIQDFLEQFGAIGVGVLMLVENILPPIPSEIVMPWAGYSVSQGDNPFWGVLVAGSLGSFAGAMFWYYLARWIGRQRLANWVAGHGAWLTITPEDLDRVDAWFDRWGAWAVFGCRMVPGLRTLISVPAGFSDMPPGKFSLYTAIGVTAWTALLAGVGWYLGENYADLAGPLGWISTLVMVVLIAWWLLRLAKQNAARREAS
ncbi:DedA family protein [Crateriforma spongiae]|uniref:DedA family protein n=1 Tax=Crateriforma spongiae TaxID=2724528 RepID=UPI001447C07E|nr:DedA family protein [Crateriforma spongiae]